MMSIALSLDLNTAWQVNTAIRGDAEASQRSGAFSRFTIDSKTLFIWGDPAQQATDATIVADLCTGSLKNYWGRSWLVVDRANRTVEAGTDVVGCFPILSFEHDNRLILASSRTLLAKLIDQPTLCPKAMREMLAFGQILDDKSILTNTRHHVGRTRLTVNAVGRMNVTTDHHHPLMGGWTTRFGDAVDAFVAAVSRVIAHTPEVLVSLSGGLDSRLILAAVLAAGGKPTAITYGDPNSTDAKIARQIADHCGIPILTGKGLAHDQHKEAFQRVASIGAGESAINHAHAIMDNDLLTQTQSRTLLTGTGAEAYRAFYYDRGMPGYSLMANVSLSPWLMPRAKRFIREEFGRTARPFFNMAPRYEAELMASLNQTIDQYSYDQLSPSLFLDNFYLSVRVARMVMAGQQLLDPFYHRSHPFLDADVVFYAGNLPVKYKLGSTFHRLAIAKLSPKLNAIEWDKTGAPMSQGLPMSTRYPGLYQRLGLNGQWGKTSTPMFNYSSWLNQLSHHQIDSVLKYVDLPNSASRVQASQNPHFMGLNAVWSQFLSPHHAQSLANVQGEWV